MRSTTVLEGGCWRVDRMLQLSCPPDEDAHRHIPPLLDCNQVAGVPWSWDVQLDCSYWLSMKGFDPEYRARVEECTFAKGSITCPYLTVEFKRDRFHEDVTMSRALSASSMALYNRYRLRNEALQVSKANWGPHEIADIRHYIITFDESKYAVWVLKPSFADGNGAWNGCQMTMLVSGDCRRGFDVGMLIKWSKEIHRWALSRHGPACFKDIEALLRDAM
jgi:hypothetical protein